MIDMESNIVEIKAIIFKEHNTLFINRKAFRFNYECELKVEFNLIKSMKIRLSA